ncbi:hypothetical protein HU200_012409 [Digitaria exilis]|uniref:Uncharacterized protein n=1 Tax=Digitaria exilis TaxID=1010633 RepID=A0A835FE39_9POAL|nr:hypothetical protein HU200_012409 [Digitaria exilis]
MASCAAETGLVAMDCLVVCCCCPCLVLQVTVFLFVRLPRKVVVKTKRIILRRWHRRRPPAATSRGLKLEELLDLDDGFEAAFGVGEGDADGWKERCFPVDGNDDGAPCGRRSSSRKGSSGSGASGAGRSRRDRLLEETTTRSVEEASGCLLA